MLVVHGVPGSWRQCFTLGQDLASTNTVVAPSRPGYGRTPLRVGRTYEEQADAYALLLDALAIDRVVVVGASGGGPSSISFAERHPARTAGLILACALAPHIIDVPAPLKLLAIPLVGEVMTALDRAIGRRRLDDPRTVERKVATDFTPDEQRRIHADPAIREALITFARTHLDAPPGLGGVRNDLVQVRRAKAAGERSYAVSAPTLVLHGDADEVCPMSHADHHAGAIAGAALEVYEEAGHIFFCTRRAEASARIREFAAECFR